MIIRRLRHAARNSSRDGFTLVELLVVIGIIAILAGVALGPITNGIKQAKHNASMQTGRQIGQMCFSYSTDNTANGNAYPADTTAAAIASDLINSNYATDPSVFLVSGQPSTALFTMTTGAVTLASSNCSWSFTVLAKNTTGGITSTASDLVPLVYFNNGPGAALVTSFTPGTSNPAITLSAACPFGTDGVAVFYKGNNAMYVKSTAGTLNSGTFISNNCLDTTAYTVAP